MAKSKSIYTTCGPMRGPCKSVYKAITTAAKGLAKDRTWCEPRKIAADRAIFAVPSSMEKDVRKGLSFRWLSSAARQKGSGVDRVAEAK